VVSTWPGIAERVRLMPEKLRPVPSPWQPPAAEKLAEDIFVLAYDQSLSSSGWAALHRSGSLVCLEGHGTLHVKAELAGHAGTFQKAHRMRMLMEDIFFSWKPCHAGDSCVIAYEATPVAGRRLESSLLGGFLVHELSGGTGIAVSPAHASKVLAGTPRHDKNEIKLAVARYVPEVLNRGWDEHSRDALAVGLTVLWDMGRVASITGIN
jgi:hypothetical protein